METKEKAIKIMEEMIKMQGSKNLSWEKAAELTKQHYRLDNKQFAGMLMLAMS
jgi:hypothetical protein